MIPTGLLCYNRSMMKNKGGFDRVINRAWLRNGDSIVTGEPLILACLLHSTGAGRDSQDMTQVQKMMNDINLKD